MRESSKLSVYDSTAFIQRKKSKAKKNNKVDSLGRNRSNLCSKLDGEMMTTLMLRLLGPTWQQIAETSGDEQVTNCWIGVQD